MESNSLDGSSHLAFDHNNAELFGTIFFSQKFAWSPGALSRVGTWEAIVISFPDASWLHPTFSIGN